MELQGLLINFWELQFAHISFILLILAIAVLPFFVNFFCKFFKFERDYCNVNCLKTFDSELDHSLDAAFSFNFA